MTVKLLTEHYLEFLSLKGGCTGSSESTLVKIPHFWKSHADPSKHDHHNFFKKLGAQWLSGSVRLGIKRLLVWTHQSCCVVSLKKTLYPLLSTGTFQEERNSS